MEITILVKSSYLCSPDCSDRLLKEGEKKVSDVITMYLGSHFTKQYFKWCYPKWKCNPLKAIFEEIEYFLRY